MGKASKPSGMQQTLFGQRYKLDVSKPLKEFDTPGGQAYMMTDVENPQSSIYGLVQNPAVPIREDVYKKLRSKSIANLICPIDRGVININAGVPSQRLVTIYKRPTGGALMGPDGKIHPKVNTTSLRQNVILSVLKALAALHRKKIIHRSILPTNLYFNTPDATEVVLGECCSCPDGFEQPFMAEALEYAFADEAARGSGEPASDLYQLGAALSCLYHKSMLWDRSMRDGIGMSRVNQGSFRALSGGKDIPGALGSLVRGLMADDLSERWTSADILDWFEGISVSKRTNLQMKNLRQATVFRGVSYVDRRLLADAFGRHPLDAAAFLRKQDFATWASISLGDLKNLGRMEQLIGLSNKKIGYSSDNKGDDYRMVANFCLFLDPMGPIRYRKVSVFFAGIPGLLAKAFAEDDRETISAILEILNPKILSTFAAILGDDARAFTDQVEKLSHVRRFAESKQLGQGMERVLYELNPELPCLSPRLKQFWVGGASDLLRSLDKIASTVNARHIMTDRHITAFLAARGEGLERMFNSINAAEKDPARFSLLVTDLFGALQKSTGIASLPSLTDKLVEGLAPALRVLKHKKRKEQVQQLLEKVKKGGDITRLTSEVNLTKIAAEDAREFSKARHQIVKMERERDRLSKKVGPTDPLALDRGYRLGSWIAFLILMGTILMSAAK